MRTLLLIFLLCISTTVFGKTVKNLTIPELYELYWDCDYAAATDPDVLTPKDLLVCIGIYSRLVETEFNDNFDRFIKWRNRNAEKQFKFRKDREEDLTRRDI